VDSRVPLLYARGYPANRMTEQPHSRITEQPNNRGVRLVEADAARAWFSGGVHGVDKPDFVGV